MAKNVQPIIKHTFNTKAHGKCICGASISAGYDENGIPGVVHDLPGCKLFNDTEDPIEFLATVNRYWFVAVSLAAVALFIYTGYQRNKKDGYQ